MKEFQDKIRSYVDSFDGVPITWGKDDCAPFAGRWVEIATGVDLKMTPYASMPEGQRLIRKHGSLTALCDVLMARGGFFDRIGDPVLGDVGIVQTGRSGDVAGIFAHGGHFLWRHAHGVSFLTPRKHLILKVWAIHHGD